MSVCQCITIHEAVEEVAVAALRSVGYVYVGGRQGERARSDSSVGFEGMLLDSRSEFRMSRIDVS